MIRLLEGMTQTPTVIVLALHCIAYSTVVVSCMQYRRTLGTEQRHGRACSAVLCCAVLSCRSGRPGEGVLSLIELCLAADFADCRKRGGRREEEEWRLAAESLKGRAGGGFQVQGIMLLSGHARFCRGFINSSTPIQVERARAIPTFFSSFGRLPPFLPFTVLQEGAWDNCLWIYYTEIISNSPCCCNLHGVG